MLKNTIYDPAFSVTQIPYVCYFKLINFGEFHFSFFDKIHTFGVREAADPFPTAIAGVIGVQTNTIQL